jgi:sialidase-1
MKIIPQYAKTIFPHGADGYVERRIPGILPVEDGLLLVCEGRSVMGSDWGDIDVLVYKVEGDGLPRLVYKIGESMLPPDGTMRCYHNPTLIPDGDLVHMIYHKNYARVFHIVSRDGGSSWSQPREITEVYRRFRYDWNVCATGPGHGIQMSNGRLVAPIWLANGQVLENGQVLHYPSVAGCVYSDDHGDTWHPGALAEDLCSGNETTVAQLPDGNLLLSIRHRGEVRCRMQAISTDGGQTLEKAWAAEDLPDPRCFGSLAAQPEGVLFANCDDSATRINLKVKFSPDGNAWQTLWEVDPLGGYPDLAVVGDDVYLLYEHQLYEPNLVKDSVLAKGRIERK